MVRFFVGTLVGAALLGAVAFFALRGQGGCLGRCGPGTRCEDHRCVAVAEPTPTTPASKERKRRPRGAGAAPEVQLRPGDEKMVAQGDALGRPERIDLSQGGDEARELQDDDLDRVFRASEPAILRCISAALGDAPLESGQVNVGLRVDKSGQVSRVRVEAPAVLQRHGLTPCVRQVVTALRFPASGGASVVTYPFELR